MFFPLLTTILFLITSNYHVNSSSPPENIGTIENFYEGCFNVKLEKLEKILQGPDLYNIDAIIESNNKSPLHILVEKVNDLAQKRGRILARQREETQNLAKEISFNEAKLQRLVQIIRTLLDKGAAVDRVTDSDWTPLSSATFFASINAHYPLEIVEMLLDHANGCKVINVQSESRTPLHFAAQSILSDDRPYKLAKLLITKCSKNIKFELKDSNGWTPLKVAMINENSMIEELLSPKAMFVVSRKMIAIGSLIVALIALIVSVLFFFKLRKSNGGEKEKIDNPEPESTESERSNSILSGSLQNESETSLTERIIPTISEEVETTE